MSDVKERPILFNAEMVRAVLGGRKTVTRRVVKPQPDHFHVFDGRKEPCVSDDSLLPGPTCAGEIPCPYGVPGDRLWVREAFRLRADQDHKPPRDDWWKSGAWYAADGAQPTGCGGGPGRLRPSIHMPRWASRITLEVTDVRVERVQDISEEDARAEGMRINIYQQKMTRRDHFKALWDSIHGDGAWERNDWVWVVTFKRIPNEVEVMTTSTPETDE